MPYNELRRDRLLNRWVVVAKERARRPTDFAKKRTETAATAICPLCPGNENMTPPATVVYIEENGTIRKTSDKGNFRTRGWLVRSIPNMFPAFAPPRNPEDEAHLPEDGDCINAIGRHEVMVETPIHAQQPPDMPVAQLVHVISMYVDRLKEFAQKPYVRYVQIFRNFGLEAGASLSHPHSQVIATPFVPPLVAEEQNAAKTYQRDKETCYFCDLIKKEKDTQRFITENKDFFVSAPYASANPMEFWIIPKHHATNLLSLSAEETETFARTLQATLGALKALVNDPPYNFGIHLSLDKQAEAFYHWHLEVYPKLSIWAGFEKSAGIYINTVPPETAASELRKAMQ